MLSSVPSPSKSKANTKTSTSVIGTVSPPAFGLDLMPCDVASFGGVAPARLFSAPVFGVDLGFVPPRAFAPPPSAGLVGPVDVIGFAAEEEQAVAPARMQIAENVTSVLRSIRDLQWT